MLLIWSSFAVYRRPKSPERWHCKKTALNFEIILLNDFKGNGANTELKNVPNHIKVAIVLCDNELSIFTEGKDLQPLDFKISPHSDRICSLQCFMFRTANKKKVSPGRWKVLKKVSPSKKIKRSKIYPAVGSEEIALADVLATASYSLEDRCDVLVRDFQLNEHLGPAF